MQSLHNPVFESLRSVRRDAGISTLLLGMLVAPLPALSQGQIEDNSILSRYDTSVQDDVVSLKTPDDEPLQYKIVDESTDTRAFFTLIRQDESEEEILFSYDEEIDEIAVTAENTELQLQIIDEEEIVAIDDAGECPWADYKCIRNAVNERLVDFEDEDVIAMLAAVHTRFNDMEDAGHIGMVMTIVADQLASR